MRILISRHYLGNQRATRFSITFSTHSISRGIDPASFDPLPVSLFPFPSLFGSDETIYLPVDRKLDINDTTNPKRCLVLAIVCECLRPLLTRPVNSAGNVSFIFLPSSLLLSWLHGALDGSWIRMRLALMRAFSAFALSEVFPLQLASHSFDSYIVITNRVTHLISCSASATQLMLCWFL